MKKTIVPEEVSPGYTEFLLTKEEVRDAVLAWLRAGGQGVLEGAEVRFASYEDNYNGRTDYILIVR